MLRGWRDSPASGALAGSVVAGAASSFLASGSGALAGSAAAAGAGAGAAAGSAVCSQSVRAHRGDNSLVGDFPREHEERG